MYEILSDVPPNQNPGAAPSMSNKFEQYGTVCKFISPPQTHPVPIPNSDRPITFESEEISSNRSGIKTVAHATQNCFMQDDATVWLNFISLNKTACVREPET